MEKLTLTIIIYAMALGLGCSTPPQVQANADAMTEGEWTVIATTQKRDGGMFGGYDAPSATLEQGGSRKKLEGRDALADKADLIPIDVTAMADINCPDCKGIGYADELVDADEWLLERLKALRWGEYVNENVVVNRKLDNVRFED